MFRANVNLSITFNISYDEYGEQIMNRLDKATANHNSCLLSKTTHFTESESKIKKPASKRYDDEMIF